MDIIDIIRVTIFILMLFCNIILHTKYWKEIDVSTSKKLIGSTGILIILSCLLWNITDKLFIIDLLLLILSYGNLCIILKRNLERIKYTIIFILLSFLFVLWITVLFGKYYYESGLIDATLYMNQVNDKFENYKWYLSSLANFKFLIIFFCIAVEKYFVPPKQYSFNDIQFIQFLIGVIINGTIIFGFFDIIKGMIVPNLNQEISKNQVPKIEISSVKLYSNGVNKVYTNRFYKAMNYNFGVEMTLKNNTSQGISTQMCIHICNAKNETIMKCEEDKTINENDSIQCNFNVSKKLFSEMKDGKYKILFLIDGKKVKKESFMVLYK